MIVLKDSTQISPLVGLFGAIVTVALFVYHLRNDQLYNELVSRAGQLERELGLYDGSFLQRPYAWHRLGFGRLVEHGWPVNVVYVSSAALWLSFALYPFALNLALRPEWAKPSQKEACAREKQALSGRAEPSQKERQGEGKSSDASQASSSPALGLTQQVLVTAPLFAISVVFAWMAMTHVSRTKDRSDGRLKCALRRAMPILEGLPVRRLIKPGELLQIARRLREDLKTGLDQEAKYFERLCFYMNPRYTERYLGSTAGEDTLGPELASRLLAQTIDQPARWIFDVYLRRR
jgi:hypothetical protein